MKMFQLLLAILLVTNLTLPLKSHAGIVLSITNKSLEPVGLAALGFIGSLAAAYKMDIDLKRRNTILPELVFIGGIGLLLLNEEFESLSEKMQKKFPNIDSNMLDDLGKLVEEKTEDSEVCKCTEQNIIITKKEFEFIFGDDLNNPEVIKLKNLVTK